MSDWDKLVIEKAIAEAQIEAAGMTAENMQRAAQGHSMAYDAQAFFDVIGRLNATFETHRARF